MQKFTIKTRVYIAGPFISNPTVNTHKAILTANLLLAKGYIPFIPHLNLLWDTVTPRQEKDWLEWDNQWLASCDYIIRLLGKSSGSDKEVKLAEQLKIPKVSLKKLLNKYLEPKEPVIHC